MSILETILSHETVVPMKKLTDITTTEHAPNFEFDMTGNTWADHNLIFLRFLPQSRTANEMIVRVNDNAIYANHLPLSGDYSKTGDIMRTLWAFPVHLLLFTGNGCLPRMCGFVTNNTDLNYVQIYFSPQQVTKISFGVSSASATTCRAGSRLEVWGIL